MREIMRSRDAQCNTAILEQASKQAGERRSAPGRGEQENWGDEREGGGGGEKKGITCSQSQIFYRTPFAHERGAIVQFDWLVARQSKSDIRNLTSIHNLTSATQQHQNTYGRVQGNVRIFC